MSDHVARAYYRACKVQDRIIAFTTRDPPTLPLGRQRLWLAFEITGHARPLIRMMAPMRLQTIEHLF